MLNVRLEGREAAVGLEPGGGRHGDLRVHITLLGMGIDSRVLAGENRGATLRHDFVVLATASAPLMAEADAYRAGLRLPAVSHGSSGQAFVAWVSKMGRQAPIQAVGGFLPAGRDTDDGDHISRAVVSP